ncbi:MAG TPA: hypothetical protein VFY18_10605 [Candidatus Limnocylindrales bacterium]|nr:hypothetical protein [Candidatus Limnocylindrales bacterium]
MDSPGFSPWKTVTVDGGQVRVLVGTDVDADGDRNNDPVDFQVDLGPTGRYAGTAATLSQLAAIMTRWADTGECLGGSYLWIDSLIVVARISPDHIAAVVMDLKRSKELTKALRRIE